MKSIQEVASRAGSYLDRIAENVMLTTSRPVMLVKPERISLAKHIDETETFLRAH